IADITELSPRTSLTTSAVSRDTLPVRAATAALGGCGAGDTFPVGVRGVHSAALTTLTTSSEDGDIYQTSLRSRKDHDDSCEFPEWGKRVAYSSLPTSVVSRDTLPVRAATAALGGCGAGDTFPVGVRGVHSAALTTLTTSSEDGDIYQTSLRSRKDHDDSCEFPEWGKRVAYSFCRSQHAGPRPCAGIPAYWCHRTAGREGARRQNSW